MSGIENYIINLYKHKYGKASGVIILKGDVYFLFYKP